MNTFIWYNLMEKAALGRAEAAYNVQHGINPSPGPAAPPPISRADAAGAMAARSQAFMQGRGTDIAYNQDQLRQATTDSTNGGALKYLQGLQQYSRAPGGALNPEWFGAKTQDELWNQPQAHRSPEAMSQVQGLFGQMPPAAPTVAASAHPSGSWQSLVNPPSAAPQSAGSLPRPASAAPQPPASATTSAPSSATSPAPSAAGGFASLGSNTSGPVYPKTPSAPPAPATTPALQGGSIAAKLPTPTFVQQYPPDTPAAPPAPAFSAGQPRFPAHGGIQPPAYTPQPGQKWDPQAAYKADPNAFFQHYNGPGRNGQPSFDTHSAMDRGKMQQLKQQYHIQ